MLSHTTSRILLHFLPFWIYLIVFKLAGGLHYSLISPFGETLFPLWIVGLIMGGGSLIQLLLDVPAGHLLDKYGYKKLLVVTTIIFFVGALCFLFKLTALSFIVSLTFATFGWLFFGPGVNAYILSHTPREASGKFISFRDVFGSVGVVLSSAVLAFALTLPSQTVGLLLSFLFLLSTLAIIMSPKDKFSVHHKEKIPSQHHYIRRHVLLDTLKAIKKLNPASGILLMLGFSASTFYGTIWFVVPLVIVHSDNSGFLSLGLGIFDFAVVILGFLLGNLADKANKRTMVFFGLLIFSIAGLFLGFNFGWLFLILGFLATAGDEMASISLWSWLHNLDREHAEDGLVSGVINLFQDLGWAVGPIFAGIFYSIIGPAWTITVSAIFIVATWLIYQFMVHRHIDGVAYHLLPRKPHRARHKS